MLFQTMDDKSECVGIYCDGELIFDDGKFPKELTKTWDYAPYLKDIPDIQYAALYLEGQQVKDVIPEYLQDDWEDVTERLNSYVRSLKIAKVDMSENCIYDLAPKRFLIDWCETKNNITKFVLKNFEKPKRYEFLLEVRKMLSEISDRRLSLDKRMMNSFSMGKNQQDRLLKAPPYIRYNQFGTKTGRLSTKKNSFPILTLKKDYRSAIKPNNDLFIELDFNGAEIRTLLGLLGKDQPAIDVHDFHRTNIFGEEFTRGQAKQVFFAWLYGSRSSDVVKYEKELEQFYEKEKILNEFWDGENVCTPLGKVIKDVSKHHALNYIVQSTTAELTLLQALKVNRLLQTQSSSSFVSAIIHDSIIIDFSKKDQELFQKIIRLMESTKFGNFVVNIEKGKTLGSMRKVTNG